MNKKMLHLQTYLTPGFLDFDSWNSPFLSSQNIHFSSSKAVLFFHFFTVQIWKFFKTSSFTNHYSPLWSFVQVLLSRKIVLVRGIRKTRTNPLSKDPIQFQPFSMSY